MELYLKKYFWVLNLVAIAVCATLAAKGVNHIIEAKYLLGDPKKKPPRPKVARPPSTPSTPSVDKKDDVLVATRNIFCLACEPPKPEVPSTTPNTPDDPLHPQPTQLPLALVATQVSRYDNALSAATITNTQSLKTGSYWVSEKIPGAGEIIDIRPRWVDFHNDALNRTERLDLLGASAPPPVATAPTAPPPTTGTPAEGDLTAEIDKGVKKIDDTHYEIDRSLVDKILADPSVIARSARIVPSIKDGKANGFKMYAIRPNSVYAKIGMQNGDTISSINGYEITSPDKALEIYTKVKSANSLSVQITRRGQPVTMEYTIK